MNDWYYTLIQPPFTPPAWIFPYAWAFLYTTILVSFIIYASKIVINDKRKGYTYFWLQILFNFLWTPAFFMLKSQILGLFVILILDILVFLTIKEFCRISKLAAWLLLPYMIWILFATYLNVGFVLLN